MKATSEEKGASPEEIYDLAERAGANPHGAEISKLCAALEKITRLDPRTLSFEGVTPRLLRLAESGLQEGPQTSRYRRALLTLLHLSALRKDIHSSETVHEWMRWALRAIDQERWTTGRMFRSHARLDPSRTLLVDPGESFVKEVSWGEAEGTVSDMARAIHALLRRPHDAWVDGENGPLQVAILSENRLEAALLDLACLTTGVPNVVISPQMIPEHVVHVLNEARPSILFVSVPSHLDKVVGWRERFPFLRAVVVLVGSDPEAMTIEELMEFGAERSMEDVLEWESRVRPTDLATVMYTSGTTGQPRGVAFSHRNLVSKRIARALALPAVGPDDRFICYLPLAHTFGRWLELLGCIFLRATYVFLINPSVDRMLRAMQRFRPTVFISVPQKWIQIYEVTSARTGRDAPTSLVGQLLRELTGGKLRFGLSAAGFLDAEVFRFFQKHGVDLTSGFGMTEATGGITMTPPGGYRDGTVGKALPGIELRVAEDGELLIRGPYVARHFTEEGMKSDPEKEWLATGDLFEADETGYYSIAGRKKDLIKNLKGETIAPQRVEQFLESSPEIEQSVLIGDARPFNVALLAVHRDAETLRGKGAQHIRRVLSNIVASVNKFLAPCERIVDFAVLPRSPDVDKGELTAKGTPRRKTIEENFSHIVEDLYERAGWVGHVGETEVRVPEWVFRRTGKTLSELVSDATGLRWRGGRKKLAIRSIGAGDSRTVQVGSLVYSWPMHPGGLNLEALLRTPALWLGNVQLSDFFMSTLSRTALRRDVLQTLPRVDRPHRPGPRRNVAREWAQERDRPSRGLKRLHRLVAEAHWMGERRAVEAVEGLAAELKAPAPGRAVLARRLLRRLLTDSRPRVACAALLSLLPNESEEDVETTLNAFVANQAASASVELTRSLSTEVLSPAQLRHLCRLAYADALKPESSTEVGPWLLGFFGALGDQRPNTYPHFREALVAWALLRPGTYGALARDLLIRLKEQYRADLRARVPRVLPSRIQMSPGIPLSLRNHVMEVLSETVCVAEAVEVLTGGALSPGRIDEAGVVVEQAATGLGEETLRIQVDLPGASPVAFHLHRDGEASPAEEIPWRVMLSLPGPRGPLSYTVGGDWPSYGVWTCQIPTESSVESLLQNVDQRHREMDPRKKASTWLNLAWTSLTAFFELWDRTGRNRSMEDPSPLRVAAPLNDYIEATRLLSLGPLGTHDNLGMLLEVPWRRFVKKVESVHPDLTGTVGWETVFSAFVEALGLKEALPLLAGLLELEADSRAPWKGPLESFLETTQSEGFRPRRLSRAVTRYHRWIVGNPTASWAARARTLNEIYETYGLDDLESEFPETRPRVFRETVFSEARPELGRELESLVQRSYRKGISFEDLLGWITELNHRLELTDDEIYFLARLAFGHLAPKEKASWMILDRGEGPEIGLVVARKDEKGRQIWIRPAARPAEITQLHHFFTDSGLHVHFHPEHDYLLLVDDNENVLGGLYYRELSREQLHLEKLVVGETYRGRGLGGDLLEEFCRQAFARGYEFVTTGFFRPGYFAKFGFRTERGMAGLVRRLREPVNKAAERTV